MEKKAKKPPLLGPAEQEDTLGEPLFSLANSACVTECTGLIQVPPQTDEELTHYNEVYSFTLEQN